VKVKDTADEPADLGLLTLSGKDITELPPLPDDLVSLRVKGCLRLRDLSALASTQVEELELDPATVDLTTLAGARLRRLTLVGGRLTDLPDLPLRSLSVSGVPTGDEIRRLALFPGLTHLAVRQPEVADLARLRVLTGLREIDLYGVPAGSASLPGVVRYHL
jgi:Leucine-rich repeat (LRR) protein